MMFLSAVFLVLLGLVFISESAAFTASSIAATVDNNGSRRTRRTVVAVNLFGPPKDDGSPGDYVCQVCAFSCKPYKCNSFLKTSFSSDRIVDTYLRKAPKHGPHCRTITRVLLVVPLNEGSRRCRKVPLAVQKEWRRDSRAFVTARTNVQ